MAETSGGRAQPPARDGSKRALGPVPHLQWLDQRQHAFLELFDFSAGKGLEIGPLDTPAVNGRASAVSSVDLYDRAGMIDKYLEDDNVLLELIPETTFPLWDETAQRVGSVADSVSSGAPFDWVVASHVIEHIPNLIAWLADIARVTGPHGALVLAAPDRRFTFDCHRPPTTAGQVIEAYLRGDDRPSARAVYDAVSTHVSVNVEALVGGARPPGGSQRAYSALSAFELAKDAADNYTDTHVWTFTTREFIELITELRGIGLCDWYVEKLAGDPRSPDFEFKVVLRKVPTGGPFSEVSFDSDLPGWLAEEWKLRETVRQLADQLAQAAQMISRLSDGNSPRG